MSGLGSDLLVQQGPSYKEDGTADNFDEAKCASNGCEILDTFLLDMSEKDADDKLNQIEQVINDAPLWYDPSGSVGANSNDATRLIVKALTGEEPENNSDLTYPGLRDE